jgi:hypothetical protein
LTAGPLSLSPSGRRWAYRPRSTGSGRP